MLRWWTRRVSRWSWQQWGLFGLATAFLIQLLIVLEIWRESALRAELQRQGVLIYSAPLLVNTPLWRFEVIRGQHWLGVPTSADFLYEQDVSPAAVRLLYWLPALRQVRFGTRWRGRRLESAPLPTAGQFVRDDDLKLVGKLTQIRSLEFNYSNITDAGLEHLSGLQSLTMLDLKRANISDAGLVSVGRLTSLVHLSLQQTNVTGTGLVHLRSLRKLTRLSLQSTPLMDGTLKALAELPELRYLDLDLTPITDDSINDLAQLKSLRELSVTNPSDQQMARLQKALPACRVQFSWTDR